MKSGFCTSLIAAFIIGIALTSPGAVFIDDDFDDGDRTDTNLPDESAWYGSTAANTSTLSAAPGSLTGHVRIFETNTSSRLWLTHFTPPAAPAELLNVGDTFKATLVFSATNIATAPPTSRGLRVGLFNFSEAGATRVNADGFSTGSGGGAPGAAVTGYMLNLNFAQAFTINSPIEIMKRTDTSNINLMGTSAVFTRVGSTGGGNLGTPGFSNDVTYTLEFTVKLRGTSVDIGAKFSDTNGWSISHTVTDSMSPNLRFDGLAWRPNSAPDTADSFTFTRFKAETFPFLPRITSVMYVPEELVWRVTWEALPTKTYEVEWSQTFAPNSWTSLGTVTATGDSASLDDGNAIFRDQTFYRVLQLP